MGKDRVLLVSCRYCRIPIAAATHFGPDELEMLLAHVRTCKPATRLPKAPGVEVILKHFEVRRIDERE